MLKPECRSIFKKDPNSILYDFFLILNEFYPRGRQMIVKMGVPETPDLDFFADYLANSWRF